MIRNAKSIGVRICAHGTIWIDLLNAEGEVFARAPLVPEVAFAVSENLLDLVQEAISGDLATRECKGYA